MGVNAGERCTCGSAKGSGGRGRVVVVVVGISELFFCVFAARVYVLVSDVFNEGNRACGKEKRRKKKTHHRKQAQLSQQGEQEEATRNVPDPQNHHGRTSEVYKGQTGRAMGGRRGTQQDSSNT